LFRDPSKEVTMAMPRSTSSNPIRRPVSTSQAAPRRRPRSGFRALVLLAVVVILALRPVLEGIEASPLIVGPLDWAAHLATALLLLVNLPRPLPFATVTAALLAVVVIDLDHLPGYLGTDFLAEGTPRPYPHSLLTVIAALAAAAALKGTGRRIALGIAIGVAAHLVRDVASGGVALFWPLSDDGVRISFWLEAAAIGALATRAWIVGAPRTRSDRRHRPGADAPPGDGIT